MCCFFLFVFFFFFAVIPPPLNARATQSSSSAPVEVSWSPPTYQGAFNITGYRIFYGSGENVSVSKIATSIGLSVEGGYHHQTVFLHSESDQLHSELVNVTVGKLLSFENDTGWVHIVMQYNIITNYYYRKWWILLSTWYGPVSL